MSQHYHFIGIGGIGMSGIAQLFLHRQIKVSGSDLKESKATQDLQESGAQVFIGHHPDNIKGADLVIYSSAIREDNPEIIAAKTSGIPLIRRAEALAELMKDKVVITVSGSHGKTTTTSLASCLLLEAGLFPTVAIGGILKNIDANAAIGNGDFFVAEADESDGTFLNYRPKYSIITNIDYEHLDYFNEFKNVIAAFKQFLGKTQDGGCIFACGDDMNLKNILKDYKSRYVLFGLKDDADIFPRNIKIDGLNSEFDCYYRNKFTQPLRARAGFIGRFSLTLGGTHNISNALSVIALGLELDIDLDCIKKALLRFKGAKRRLEIKFNNERYLVLDDYAHHPTEIRATLAAIKNLKYKRILAIFQPHRYTRTKLLLDEFSKSFDLVDELIITDIYPANEPPIEGISSRSILDKIRERSPRKKTEFLPKEEIPGHILEIIKPHDLIITLGAGDITKTCDELVARLKG